MAGDSEDGANETSPPGGVELWDAVQKIVDLMFEADEDPKYASQKREEATQLMNSLTQLKFEDSTGFKQDDAIFGPSFGVKNPADFFDVSQLFKLDSQALATTLMSLALSGASSLASVKAILDVIPTGMSAGVAKHLYRLLQVYSMTPVPKPPYWYALQTALSLWCCIASKKTNAIAGEDAQNLSGVMNLQANSTSTNAINHTISSVTAAIGLQTNSTPITADPPPGIFGAAAGTAAPFLETMAALAQANGTDESLPEVPQTALAVEQEQALLNATPPGLFDWVLPAATNAGTTAGALVSSAAEILIRRKRMVMFMSAVAVGLKIYNSYRRDKSPNGTPDKGKTEIVAHVNVDVHKAVKILADITKIASQSDADAELKDRRAIVRKSITGDPLEVRTSMQEFNRRVRNFNGFSVDLPRITAFTEREIDVHIMWKERMRCTIVSADASG